MPAMSGVAERAEVGVVRRDDQNPAARADQAMKLLHGADDVGNVLDDVHGAQGLEGTVAERVGEPVQVAQNVGAATGIAIDADRARIFVDATADVESPCRGHIDFRHSSSVSTAKSA